jgi:hypothetical protein
MMKIRCKYCRKLIAPCGMAAHMHFRHLKMILAEFRHNPIISYMRLLWKFEGYRDTDEPLALPAPNPLTVYSRRPLGRMAKPFPWMKRPKGYE